MTEEQMQKELDTSKSVVDLEVERIKLEKKYALLLESTVDKSQYEERISELEIKMAKLWAILTDKTEKRKEAKITKFGQSFKDKLNARLGK